MSEPSRDQRDEMFKGSPPLEEVFPGEEVQKTQQPPQAQPATTEAQTARQHAMDLAIQVGEDPSMIHIRQDVSQILGHMQQGVIVKLTIKRPRFMAKLTADLLGLETTSQEANATIESYFKLGRRALLPKDLLESKEPGQKGL